MDRTSKPSRHRAGAGRAAVTAALVGCLALAACTPPTGDPTAGSTPVAVQSPVASLAASPTQLAPPKVVAPSPTPAPSATPDVVLAAIAHLSPSERLDDRTAASADWPLVAVDPARQPTPETKTVEQTITHVVVKGETLASIANQSGVSVDAIIQANNLSSMNVLAVGQRLAIPTGKQSIVTTISRVADTLEPHFIWPARAPITTYFGERGTIWKGGSHTGLDIGANFGTPIIAAEAGVVLEAGWATTRGYGNYVKIDNGLGYQTLYGHMSVIRAKEGQVVNRGDRIGDVGSTGVSTGPHLHFEMQLNGQPVDPLPYLPKS